MTADPVCIAALDGHLGAAAYLYLCVLPPAHEGVHKARGPSGTFILATWDDLTPGAHRIEVSA